MNKNQFQWERISNSYKQFYLAMQDFFAAGVDRVGLIKSHLNGKDRQTAIFLLGYLSKDEITLLFDDLIFLSSFSHGSIQNVRKIIKSLPRDWLLANIEKYAEPILLKGGYDEYRRLLELYIELDYSLTLKLAKRAICNEDQDIKEAGGDFIRKLTDLGYKES